MDTYQMGDHLVSNRGWYDHHGIYIGCGQVIHYAGLSDGLRSGKVCQVSLATFENGCGSYRQYHSDAYPPARIVARAKSRLGEDEYDVLTNNCEHFANWCVTGEHYSGQADINLIAPLTHYVGKRVVQNGIVGGGMPTLLGDLVSGYDGHEWGLVGEVVDWVDDWLGGW